LITSKEIKTDFFSIFSALGVIFLTLLAACTEIEQRQISSDALPETTQSPTFIVPSTGTQTTTSTRTQSPTAGPSPTSTPLPPFTSFSWEAQPIMIEAAKIKGNPLDYFNYTPFFILYGDGFVVKRSCDEGECRYLQSQLDQDALCQLVNSLALTGFLSAKPEAFSVPGSSDTEIALRVNLYQINAVQISDLDKWVESPGWYQDTLGCTNCFTPPSIDPAFIALYQLLRDYPNSNFSGLRAERLALMLTKPIIAGDPQPWSETITPLSQLAQLSLCPEGQDKRQAVVLEGAEARSIAEFVSMNRNEAALFSEWDQTWQVQTRWLLPLEMPQTCQGSAGFYPPPDYPDILWSCDPGMGTIPSPTPTITPTPSITPTPLR